MDNNNTIFPEEMVLQNGSSYILAHDIKTIQDLCREISEADEKDKILYVAYWTKKHLKVFGYGEGSGILSKVPDHFENDFDLATPIYASDNFNVVYFLSTITEALYQIDPECVAEDNELGYRIRKGIEYQIYRKIR